ncbi:MAG: cytochrome c [Deltaproteobacteria bacterium]|nr:cytochrome c [Deltaproteobacteria bacterium]
MKKNKLILAFSLAALLSPAAASAMPWSWDMYSQPSYKAQEDLPPQKPQGTVPTKGRTNIKERVDAVRIKNPMEPKLASIERGEARFNIYCATCHGDGGKGDGVVGQKYVAPTDLTSDYVQAKPDGDIFYTITYGGLAIMPSYGDSVPAEDRWHIVNYIKHGLNGGAQKPLPATAEKK